MGILQSKEDDPMIPKDSRILTALAANMHLLAGVKASAARSGKTMDEYIAGHPDPAARRVLPVLWEMSKKRKSKEAALEAAEEKEGHASEIATRDQTITKQAGRIEELERLVNRMTEARMRDSADQRRRASHKHRSSGGPS